MTKEQKDAFFKALFAKEVEYNRIAEEEGRHTPRQLAEMLDSTGYVDDYNRLIRLGLEDAYMDFSTREWAAISRRETWRKRRKSRLKAPENLKSYLKENGIKLCQLSNELGYKDQASLSYRLKSGFKPEEWKAVQTAIHQLIEGG